MNKTTDTLELKIAKARESLSQESRNSIDAVSWGLIIEGINKAYSEEQIETLKTETELLLCGLISTVDFPKELETRMKLSRAEVLLLLGEMDKLIFKKIQEELENRIAQKEKSETTKNFIPDIRFGSLPKENQEAIFYSNWKEKLPEISTQFKLNIEKQGFLEEITAKTLSGLIPASQYENELKSKIGLDDIQNKEMVSVLNEKIFKKIKDFLINGANKKSSAPLPPYARKREESPVIPNTEINKIENPVVFNKTIPPAPQENKADIYREHGIEIISGQENYKEEIPNSLINEDIATQKNQELIKKTEKTEVSLSDVTRHDFNPQNIMANKLSGKTVSNSTLVDYSLPKISGVSHDPYHEEIK